MKSKTAAADERSWKRVKLKKSLSWLLLALCGFKLCTWDVPLLLGGQSVNTCSGVAFPHPIEYVIDIVLVGLAVRPLYRYRWYG